MGDVRAERKVGGVQEVYHVAGEDCYMMKVWAADNDDLGRLLLEKVHPVKGILATRTTIVLKTVKENTRIPLGRDLKSNNPVLPA